MLSKMSCSSESHTPKTNKKAKSGASTEETLTSKISTLTLQDVSNLPSTSSAAPDDEWESASSTDSSDFSDLEIDTILQLKITLKHIKPKIWRRIQVSSSITFDELHQLIQLAMGWRMCHMHRFQTKEVLLVDSFAYGFYKNTWGGPVKKEEDVEIREYFREYGSKVLYEYDMGDGWEHEIVFEKIVLTPGEEVDFPRCVGGKRACPPEDCGGVHGYKHLLAVKSNPQHEEYSDLIENWLEEFYPGFDPEKFDKEEVFKDLVYVEC